MSVLGDVDCYKLNQSDINRAFKNKFCVVGSRIAFLKSTTTPCASIQIATPSLFRQGLYKDFLPQNDPRDESGLPFDKTDSMTRLHSNRPTTSSFSILVLLPVSKGGQGLEFEETLQDGKGSQASASFTNRREEHEHKCNDFRSVLYIYIVVRPTSNL